jgi:NAD(P)-dependent dehydrogenase (short-subunit alcohol dehydrogenase family)
MTEIRLDAQVAIVTGSGRGIGREYALDLARHGAAVVVNDLDRDLADAVVAEIEAEGGTAAATYDSVSTPEGGAAIVQAALDRFGGVDAVVNNAGFLRTGMFEDLTVEQIDAIVDVHLRGTFFVTQPAYRVMKERGHGRIVAIASNAGAFGMPGHANYAAAKGGVIGLVRALAVEGTPHGIFSNAVLPTGRTTISANDPIPGLSDRFHAARELLESRSTPFTNAPLVTFLCSRSCTVSGEVFSSCAGRYARAFMGLTRGWVAPDADATTADDIAGHFDEIRDQADYLVPESMVDEYEDVAARLPV